ncbi:DUF839 domain-containing protein [Algibacter sp.]|nr:DUF839 domain-containing protein [Algibacter sp.]
MKKYWIQMVMCLIIGNSYLQSQNIGDFTSINPMAQTEQFAFPSTHSFQKLVEVGDALTEGGIMPINNDFTGYVPILNSSANGFLSVSSENRPGGVTIFDINFNTSSKLWETTLSQAVDFSPVFGTVRNCSGTVTPWNTIITSEESTTTLDENSDGYNDYGWNVEVDPVTKTVIAKHWAMGNFAHENIVVHPNERTAYQGADSNPGYLYKFVANTAQDLSSGLLYVYSGSKNGSGNWLLLGNTTQSERNSTLLQSANLGATIFNGIEDVEIGPNGWVYFAVKREGQVYRFNDSHPISGTTVTMETFVGNTSYSIEHEFGTTLVDWGNGNDNLAFDGDGNLWVLQDGGREYIWVVESGHSQTNPKVKIFGISPIGSEPTGITFSPDFKYLFMSIQHPSPSNAASQIDAAGNEIHFNKGTVLVIALNENLGKVLAINNVNRNPASISVSPNPLGFDKTLNIYGKNINTVELLSITGRLLKKRVFKQIDNTKLKLNNYKTGIYILRINSKHTFKIVIK